MGATRSVEPDMTGLSANLWPALSFQTQRKRRISAPWGFCTLAPPQGIFSQMKGARGGDMLVKL